MISGKTVFAACMAAASVFGAVADTVAYTNAGSPSSWWGTGKSETYDVAVHLGADFKGLEVRSVSFIAGEDADVALARRDEGGEQGHGVGHQVMRLEMAEVEK